MWHTVGSENPRIREKSEHLVMVGAPSLTKVAVAQDGVAQVILG